MPRTSGSASTSDSRAIPAYGSRSRGSQPAIGIAKERPADYYGNIGGYYPVNPFSPWGRWYPWYNTGLGYGYVSFDPWRYGSSRYSLYRYGNWYNPYDPYCYSVGYWMCDVYSSGGRTAADDEPDDDEPTGSVRLRVSPAHAKVYVDGTLVGQVDDFDGLTGHLKLTLGTHLVEIKADGYETFVPELSILEGKTTTVRGTLKKVVK